MDLIQRLRRDQVILDRQLKFSIGDIVDIRIKKRTYNSLIVGFSRSGNSTNMKLIFKTVIGAAQMSIALNDPRVEIIKVRACNKTVKKFRRAKNYYLGSPEKYSLLRKIL